MPLDPNIPLSVQPAQIQSPVQSIGMLMNMRGLASEVQLRQAQAEEMRQRAIDTRAQADQRNRDLGDQNTIQDLMKDPETAKAITSGDVSALGGKVQLGTIDKVRAAALKAQQDIATTHGSNVDAWIKTHGAIGQAGGGLLALPDADAVAQFPGTWSDLSKAGLIEPGTPMPTVTSKDDIRALLAKNSALMGALEGAAKLRTATADAALKEAEVPGKEATARLEIAKAKLMESAMSGGAMEKSGIDTIIPPDKYPQDNLAARAAYKLGLATGDPAKAQENVMKIYAEKIAPVEKAAAEIPGAIKKAVSVAQAEAPIHVQTAVATQNALNKLGNAAVANVPPHLVPVATADYQKTGKDYAGAVSAQQEMQDIINLARSGNKVAYAYAPTTGVLTINSANGTKRVNMTEIQQYGAAGSSLDHLKAWFGGKTEGATIPANILNDMETLHNTLGTVAQHKHANEVKVINQTYGSKFEPMKLEGGSASINAGVPTPKTQAEYDALPKGASFMKVNDSTVYHKK